MNEKGNLYIFGKEFLYLSGRRCKMMKNKKCGGKRPPVKK